MKELNENHKNAPEKDNKCVNVVSKLRNIAGETIAETLVSLLISSLALTMLAGAITTTFSMVKDSRKVLKTYYDKNEDESGVVKMEGTDKPGKVVIKESSSIGLEDTPIDIWYYENDGLNKDNTVISYKPK